MADANFLLVAHRPRAASDFEFLQPTEAQQRFYELLAVPHFEAPARLISRPRKFTASRVFRSTTTFVNRRLVFIRSKSRMRSYPCGARGSNHLSISHAVPRTLKGRISSARWPMSPYFLSAVNTPSLWRNLEPLEPTLAQPNFGMMYGLLQAQVPRAQVLNRSGLVTGESTVTIPEIDWIPIDCSKCEKTS